MSNISDDVWACRDCPLGELRKNAVVYQGDPNPDVLFIGEVPGVEEDESGEPFVGAAGKTLRRKLETIEMSYGMTNILKCRAPKDKISKDHVEKCRKFLIRQVEELNPKVIVAVGGYSLAELTGVTGITKNIQKILFAKPEYGMRQVIGLINPAAVLHNQKNVGVWENGWSYLKKLLVEQEIAKESEDKIGMTGDIHEVKTSAGVLYGVDQSQFESTGETQGFVHLHVHSEHSTQDAFGRLKAIIYRAQAMGFPAISLTDHGNMNGAWKFYKECNSVGIKPIIGIEMYVSATLENKEKLHVVLLAKNYPGYQDLMEMTAVGCEQFHRRPRITFDQLLEFGQRKNLVCLTACASGLLNLERDKLKEVSDCFGDDFYLEVQPHAWERQLGLNKQAMELAKAWKKKIVVTNDVHYLTKDDVEVQDTIKKANGMTPFNIRTIYMCSETELREMLKEQFSTDEIDDMLANTLEVTDKCNVEIPKGKNVMPIPKIPEGFTMETYIRFLIDIGFSTRLQHLTPEEVKSYRERIEYELKMIVGKGYTDYFLIVYNCIQWCLQNDVEYGPGRGSVGGSLVAYCLYIHDVNPIDLDLTFERFISPTRTDLPDIDMDFSSRDKVIAYLKEEYGGDNVLHMGIWVTLTGRACLKDVARALEVPFSEVNKVTSAIVKRSGGDARADYTIEDSFEQFDVCRAFNRKYPRVKSLAGRLEGHLKNYGTHAAGVIVTPEPWWRHTPAVRAKGSGNTVSGYEGGDIEELGMLKLDILGLTTLSVLQMAKKLCGADFTWHDIDMDDAKVFKEFSKGNTLGVFQFESLGITKMSKSMDIEEFEDIVALNALHRPGPLHAGLAAEYIRTRNGHTEPKMLHPIHDAIMKKTLGYPIYQEQILRVLHELGELDWAKVNMVRKIIKHSTGVEAFAKQRELFIQGATKHDCTAELAREIFDRLIFFGSYGFNKAHASEYAVIAYRCMYMKVYHPRSMMLAVLRHEGTDIKVSQYIRECKRLEIPAVRPCVNNSHRNWVDKNGKFFMGLSKIAHLKKKTITAIINGQPYNDVWDLAMCVKMGEKELINLAKAGALRDICPNTKWILDNIESIRKVSGRKLGKGQKKLSLWGEVTEEKTIQPWDGMDDFTEAIIDGLSASVVPYPVEDTILRGMDEVIAKYFPSIPKKIIKISDIDFEKFHQKTVYLRVLIPSADHVNWKIVGMEGGAFASESIGMEGAKYLHANSIDETDFVLLHFAPAVYKLYKDEWDAKYFQLGRKGGSSILIKGRVNPWADSTKKITKIYIDNFVFLDDFAEAMEKGDPVAQPWAEYLMGTPLWALATKRGENIDQAGDYAYILKKVILANGAAVLEVVNEDNEFLRVDVGPRELEKYGHLIVERTAIPVTIRKSGWKPRLRRVFDE